MPGWRLRVVTLRAIYVILTAAGLLITPGLAGHPSTGRLVGLAVPFDLVHLAAVSVWVGGLAMLAAAAFNNDTRAAQPSE